MILIDRSLPIKDFQKAEAFLKKIKPLLFTNEFQFQISQKNKAFDQQYNLTNNQKIDIIKSLTADDCVKIEPNNNSKYAEAEVYVFIKCVELVVYGEGESHKLYVKMYLIEQTRFDKVIVISFHEEGQYD